MDDSDTSTADNIDDIKSDRLAFLWDRLERTYQELEILTGTSPLKQRDTVESEAFSEAPAAAPS